MTKEVVFSFAGSLSLFSSTSSISEKSVPVEEGATGEGSTMLSGAFGDGGARCACFSLEFVMAITEPGINAGLGDPGLSEKGENVDIRALADGGLRGDRTAIIMATYATEWALGVRLRLRKAGGAKKDVLRGQHVGASSMKL